MNATTRQSDTPLNVTVDAWDCGWQDVGDGHRIYYEQSGNPAGVPVIVLHGGPGSGCSARQRQLLDPEGFRVVMFDQRGCGRSTPRGECRDNHTLALIADIEQLRQRLGITRWLVFGGSWGSSLGVAYCAYHRNACLGAILRGIFLTGDADIAWFFNGSAALHPTAWQRLAAVAPEPRRSALASWYFDTVSTAAHHRALEAVACWMQWEEALTQVDPTGATAAPPCPNTDTGTISAASCTQTPRTPTPAAAAVLVTTPPAATTAEQLAQLDKYRIQAHYLRNQCFLGEKALLQLAATLRDLPVALLHGRHDCVCRPINASRLCSAIPAARLKLIDGAGHNPFVQPMANALLDAGRHFLAHHNFDAWNPGS